MDSFSISKFDSLEERKELFTLVKDLSEEERNDLSFNFSSETLTFYKMSLKDKIIGIMMVELSDFRCEDFRRFILSDYRRKGLGKSFIDFLKSELPEKIKTIECFVKIGNEKGKLNLKSHGFRKLYDSTETTHFRYIRYKRE